MNLSELDEQIADLICEHGVIIVLGSVRRFIGEWENIKRIQNLEPFAINHAGNYIDNAIAYLNDNQTQKTKGSNATPISGGELFKRISEGQTSLANEIRKIIANDSLDEKNKEGKYFSYPCFDTSSTIDNTNMGK